MLLKIIGITINRGDSSRNCLAMPQLKGWDFSNIHRKRKVSIFVARLNHWSEYGVDPHNLRSVSAKILQETPSTDFSLLYFRSEDSEDHMFVGCP